MVKSLVIVVSWKIMVTSHPIINFTESLYLNYVGVYCWWYVLNLSVNLNMSSFYYVYVTMVTIFN